MNGSVHGGFRAFFLGAGTIVGPWGRPSAAPFEAPRAADWAATYSDWAQVTQDVYGAMHFYDHDPVDPNQQQLFEPDEVSKIGR